MGKINKNGRPKKFDDGELLEIVKNYIKELNESEPIRITKLAEGLKSKGVNVVYQDLKRYKDVYDYIQEYNLKFTTKPNLEGDSESKKKNIAVGGRPRKFDEDELLIAVKGYVRSLGKGQIIKVSKVAKYFQSKGIKVTYQDLGRYPKVHKFILDYNEKYKKILFNGLVDINIEKQKPIFEQINPEDFLKRNKTPEEIEKSLLILNQTNEKLVESTEKLQSKIILQNEKIINQSNEIESLKSKIKYLELELENRENEFKEERRKNKEKIMKFNRRMAIYDQFIKRYHYANLAEFALCLEENIHLDKIKHIDGFIDKDKYASGDLNLKDIADKYFSFQLAVENAVSNYIQDEDEDYIYTLEKEDVEKYIDEFTHFEETSDKDSSESSDNGIESMDLSIEDLNSSLSILDDI